MERNLPSAIQLAFSEHLKENPRTWVAYQRLLLDDIRKNVSGLNQSQKDKWNEVLSQLTNLAGEFGEIRDIHELTVKMGEVAIGEMRTFWDESRIKLSAISRDIGNLGVQVGGVQNTVDDVQREVKEIHDLLTSGAAHGLSAPPGGVHHGFSWETALHSFYFRVKPLPKAYLYTCDRMAEFGKLLAHKKKVGNRHQFYFILSCPTQQPDTLVRHFVFYQLENELTGDGDSTIHFSRETNFEAIKIHLLGDYPTKIKLMNTWIGQLPINGTPVSDWHTLPDFVQHKLPEYRYTHVISAFECSIDGLDKETLEALIEPWMGIFNSESAQDPLCLFFFIIKAPEIHLPNREGAETRTQEVIQYIRSLPESHNQVCLIDQIGPVDRRPVEDWLGQTLEGYNPIQVFEQWGLKKHPGISFAGKINMDLIHQFQRDFWEFSKRSS
ncbi:MAG: hypothetical protein IPK21_06700 [Haliscomenobacter sp.]|nr:hypothetical protein [Haliscomenobacter sp.]